ncbi:amidase family protein [Microbacterium sp. NIBRBAC000506063]|uniref:amidase family protein n=1 Tax=Microbacterium sp. NIBRBAC000506063 TaxID=2734618 RepID=UPI0021D44B46|nr:amidase family protein [Microbacterium sp. NIBRBAC000506063]
MSGADFLVLPTSPIDALAISHDITDVERTSRGWDVLANTGAFNVTGHPALSIPINTPGLPVGAMLVARHNHDEELLDFARWASEGAAPSTEG